MTGAGATLGAAAGDIFSKVTGFGDYHITKNSLVNSVPRFGNETRTRIKHLEFIRNVASDGEIFNITGQPINPGNPLMFPWLSTLAANYEQYEPHGIIIYYRSTSGFAIGGTNTALGKVVMSTNYDVLDPLYGSMIEMEASEFCTSSVTCHDSIHPIECSKSSNPLHTLYVTNSTALEDADARFHDLGTFQLATEGQQASSLIGELWISYDITFKKPKLGSIASASTNVVYKSTGLPTPSIAAGASSGNMMGGTDGLGNQVISGSSTLVHVATTPSQPDRVHFLKNGRYVVVLSATGDQGMAHSDDWGSHVDNGSSPVDDWLGIQTEPMSQLVIDDQEGYLQVQRTFDIKVDPVTLDAWIHLPTFYNCNGVSWLQVLEVPTELASQVEMKTKYDPVEMTMLKREVNNMRAAMIEMKVKVANDVDINLERTLRGGPATRDIEELVKPPLRRAVRVRSEAPTPIEYEMVPIQKRDQPNL